MTATDVSVVITTTGLRNADLLRALESVRRQNGVALECVLVFDSAYPRADGILMNQPFSMEVVGTGGGAGGNAARNLGVRYAKSPYIAFLDDDDEWLPDKLSHQLAEAQRLEKLGLIPIIATRSQVILPRGSRVWPRKLFDERNLELSKYLLNPPGISPGGGVIHTSMLMVSRKLFERVEFREDLRRMQEWDFLIRAKRDVPECSIVMLEDVLTVWHCERTAGRTSNNSIAEFADQWLDSLSLQEDVKRSGKLNLVFDSVVRSDGRVAGLRYVLREHLFFISWRNLVKLLLGFLKPRRGGPAYTVANSIARSLFRRKFEPGRTPGAVSASPRVLYFAVRDESYPRNERLRRILSESLGAQVSVVPAEVSGNKVFRYVRQLRSSLKEVNRGYDAIFLAEFANHYAVFAWLIARTNRALLVVDFFVGLYETQIEDFGYASPGSLRAVFLRFADRRLLRASDVAFTDTATRAANFAALADCPNKVLEIPVGAPAWARPDKSNASFANRDKTLRILYYGNYLPLHGAHYVVGALSQMLDTSMVESIFIGTGEGRHLVEMSAEALGSSASVKFLDFVPAQDLASYIDWSDVVLGVFGTSRKARSVVANKVWQGLYAGRTVLTAQSDSLSELPNIAQRLLRLVEPGDVSSISQSLIWLCENLDSVRKANEGAVDYWIQLEGFVDEAAERVLGQALSRPTGPGRENGLG